MFGFCRSLARRKNTEESSEGESKLARVLTLFDLTALGVGSTLGLGVYVLAGAVAYQHAGPAVTLSFLFAAIASAFAGLCYAEFAARVPKAGSAYIYSYVTIGEFVAFTIGWNLVLEYVIGTASVARGLSVYLDALMDNKMSNALQAAMPINVNFLSDYPDFFSFAIVLVVAGLLAFGVKESSWLNTILTALNLFTVCVIIVAGAIKSDPANWAIKPEDIPEGVDGGVGGFMPYGIAGVMAGAAKCFYGFVGFDCVATTGEEAKNPKRDIPLAIVFSLLIIFFSYFSCAIVLTMMWPYYDQDPNTPFLYVFDNFGWTSVKWIVTIGAIFALCTNIVGCMFPLPRVLYAMAKDGIIFTFFNKVNDYTKTPLIATMLAGLLAAIMALIFDLQQLIDMMSIGTLLAYTIVAICVLILRYQNDDIDSYQVDARLPAVFKQVLNLGFLKVPNSLSSMITKYEIIVYSILCVILCSLLGIFHLSEALSAGEIAGLAIVAGSMLLIVVCIQRQPVSGIELTFRVPLVPFIPCLSVFINLYLMFQLDMFTWIRFLVWMVVGYIIYFCYGMRKSVQGQLDKKRKSQQKLENITNGHDNSAYVHNEAANGKFNGNSLI